MAGAGWCCELAKLAKRAADAKAMVTLDAGEMVDGVVLWSMEGGEKKAAEGT